MKRVLAALGVGLVTQMACADEAALRREFAPTFEASKLVALSVGVQTGAEAPIQLSAGQLSKTDPTPVPDTAQWHIGSITKSFTATMVMMLVEEGRMSLDAPLPELLPADAPQMHATWRDITLREVLSHTAGLAANPTRKEILAAVEGTRAAELLPAHWDKPLPNSRGSYLYSNLGYILAGRIIEEITQTTWENALKTRITAPLGLTSVGVGAPDLVNGHRGGLFGRTPVDPSGPGADNPPVFTPAGRLHAHTSDMLRFGRFLLDACAGQSSLLSKDACSTMMTPVSENYGLGLVHFPISGFDEPIVGHDGSNTMWHAYLLLFPERDTTAFVATNSYQPRKLDKAMVTLLRAYLDK